MRQQRHVAGICLLYTVFLIFCSANCFLERPQYPNVFAITNLHTKIFANDSSCLVRVEESYTLDARNPVAALSIQLGTTDYLNERPDLFNVQVYSPTPISQISYGPGYVLIDFASNFTGETVLEIKYQTTWNMGIPHNRQKHNAIRYTPPLINGDIAQFDLEIHFPWKFEDIRVVYMFPYDALTDNGVSSAVAGSHIIKYAFRNIKPLEPFVATTTTRFPIRVKQFDEGNVQTCSVQQFPLEWIDYEPYALGFGVPIICTVAFLLVCFAIPTFVFPLIKKIKQRFEKKSEDTEDA